MKSNTVSVSGHLCIDYIITVDEYPPVGESRRVFERKIYFGGGAANIAAGIARLGGEAELICAVGQDYPGSEYEKYLDELGVATTLFTSDKNCSTAFMVNNAAGEQITYFEWGAGEAFSRAAAPARDFIHMATGDAAFNISIARQAKFASLDPGQDVKYYTADDLTSLLGEIDILICNNYEMEIIKNTLGWSEKDILDSVPFTIITHGKSGSSLFFDGRAEQIPAFNVEAKDPTGAGDAYRAGFFTAWKKGLDPVTCAKVGTTAASFAVEKTGTQTNLPDWETMAERYRSAFGRLES
ncbi:MAG: PfkB family carbohydrate kinase [Methanocorpusculum sp.]|uniref:PfkB family carbohydrate kinase n=1 Tax=Methanocorpusculum TaxID=2192 RepID=UPI001FD7923E|nr:MULTISPECIES: PfkB family carbohydrate kinase [Methanocorpusculum]MDD2248873.1 PfkB family carbohydrate kinase [Methanocorpusculum sp.]MDD2803536.1 PfkB family carbohydrate kinase [Methanocorpusculum sp.]MDD3912409.1 PfkB family carbohydrate kinase [Methanocorpusculum sp.]MDD4423547.1 PfkB family carbohydrate kinase [Methanocorpusculum parvum]HJJ34367.1 PfkB family carbohydrate kinase [Methanocorpusculum sp.]